MDFSCARNDGCNEGRAPGKPAVVIPVPGKGGPISKKVLLESETWQNCSALFQMGGGEWDQQKIERENNEYVQ